MTQPMPVASATARMPILSIHSQESTTRSAMWLDKRDRHAAEPVKISGKRVARKAENIKQRNKLHIFPAAFKGRAAVCAQHEADRRAGRQVMGPGLHP